MFGRGSLLYRLYLPLLGISFVVFSLGLILFSGSSVRSLTVEAADSSAVFVRNSKCWKSCSFEDEVLNKLDLILGELNVATANLNKVKK